MGILKTTDFIAGDTSRMSIAALAEATNATFAGYVTPITHTPLGFAAFCRQFSLDVGQSVQVQHWDGRLAGLAMLGVRGARGWCGGFGVVPEFRGRGVAGVLAAALIDRARSLSLRTLQLEVLVQNERAIRVYRRAGFQPVRDLVILSAEAARAVLPWGADDSVEVGEAAPEEALLLSAHLWPESAVAPSWQREPVSLLAMTDVRGLVARRAGDIRAVLIARPSPQAGQIAILHLAFGEEAAAIALLQRAAALPEARAASAPQFVVLNEPEGSPLLALLRRVGLQETHRQWEMILPLAGIPGAAA